MFDLSLLHLLRLCDPSLPIGGFSHSAGLETYVQKGFVKCKKTLLEFVANQLEQNIKYSDAAILALSYDAAMQKSLDRIIQLDELCTAIKLAREIRISSFKLGLRLLKLFSSEENSLPYKYLQLIQKQKCDGHYCIAFALIANELKIDKAQSLTGFYYNAASNFITNGVNLIPLGQQDGQLILMELFPMIQRLARISISPDELLIGYCNNGFDIRAMQHETLYTRLYMS